MSSVVWAALGGSVLTLGILLVLARALPAHVDLADAVGRFTPPRHPVRTENTGDRSATPHPDGTHRLGLWAARTLPPALWTWAPTRDLALLQIPLVRFYGDKTRFAIVGALTVPFLIAPLAFFDVHVPVAVALGGAILVAGAAFFLPDYNAADQAKRARQEARRALTAYVDLVALERAAGSMVGQAMQNAATVARSWVFTRIAQELDQSQWSGVPPWTALKNLADDLGLPELHDVADILEMSGTESTSAYETLQARSAAMRAAILNDDLADANATSERMTIPATLLVAVFIVLIGTPAVLGILLPT
jgi:pilus assembly protein TadC